jgi:hypothetical protein
VRHRRIGSTDLVGQRGRAGGVAAGRRAGGAVRRGRGRLLGGRPRPGHRLLRGHRQRRPRPGRGAARPALRGHRDEVTVATTFGYDTTPRPWEPAPRRPRHDWSADFAGPGPGPVLRRLRLEPVDLWLLHHPGMDASSRRAVRVPGGPGREGQGPPLRGGPRSRARLGRRGRGRPPGAAGRGRRDRLQRGRAGAGPRPGRAGRRDRGRPGVPRPAGPAAAAAARAASSSWSGTATRPSTRRCSASPWPTRRWPPPCPRCRDRDHLAELAGAPTSTPPTAEDLDRSPSCARPGSAWRRGGR